MIIQTNDYFKYVTDLHPLNALDAKSTFSFELSITTSKFLQSANAPFFIVVTLDGIITLVNLEQPLNASIPIVVTPSQMVKLVISKQL